MLTPDQLDALPRRFVQLWQQVEDDILQDIARRMKSLGELDPLTPTAIWQAWRLAETRAVRSNTVATLARYTGKSRAEIPPGFCRFAIFRFRQKIFFHYYPF